MTARRSALAAALLALLLATAPAGHGAPEGPDHYIRNRPVQGRLEGGDVFVAPGSLGRYLTEAETARVSLAGGSLLVDGAAVAPLGPAGEVPLVALARALGFEVRRNPDLGTVDLVPPAALQTREERSRSAGGLDAARRPEYRLAEARMKKVASLLRVVASPALEERLQAVGGRVADVTPLAGLPWKFYLVEDPEPNAACVGEGHVFVTTGLMAMGLTDDELAGVLGHEIAHGVRRHPFRLLDLVQEYRDLVAEIEDLEKTLKGQAVPPNYVALRNRASELEKRAESLVYRAEHERSYDRAAEEEADILGIRYAVAAGYSADGLGRALERLEGASVTEFGQAVLDEDMTHPPLARRLEILRRVRASLR